MVCLNCKGEEKTHEWTTEIRDTRESKNEEQDFFLARRELKREGDGVLYLTLMLLGCGQDQEETYSTAARASNVEEDHMAMDLDP